MAGYEGSKHFPCCDKQVSDQHGANQMAGIPAMMGEERGRKLHVMKGGFNCGCSATS